MQFRDPFNDEENRRISDETSLFCHDESKAIQSQAEEADINVLVRRFGITGGLPAAFTPPEFIDSDDVFDYQEAQNLLIQASRNFMLIPAEIRREFDNDPIKFVEFATDEKNLPRLRELGLAKPLASDPPPVRVQVIPSDNPPGA